MPLALHALNPRKAAASQPKFILALHNCGMILSQRINHNPRVTASGASPRQSQSSHYLATPLFFCFPE